MGDFNAKNAKKVAKDMAKKASKSAAKRAATSLMTFIASNILIILKVVMIGVVILVATNILQYAYELITAEKTPEQIYEELEVESLKDLVQIVGNEQEGYHLEYVSDIDEKINQIIDVLGSKSGMYTISEKDTDIIKKMIKAEVYTQFPDLAGSYNEENGEFQGAVKIRRVTPNKDIGEMKNTGTGEVTTLGDEKEEDLIQEEKSDSKPTIKTDNSQSSKDNSEKGTETIGDKNKEYVLAIAAGHNNTDNTGAAPTEEFIEQDMTIQVAEKVEELFSKYSNVKVVQTGSTSENPGGIGKDERVQLAKDANPDLCIQIHFNASETHTASGVEVWYEYGDGYSQSLADILSSHMSTQMGLENRGSRVHENNSDYWTIIDSYYQTNFPSVITEGGFLDNENDQEVLRNGGIDKYAQAIVDGCIEYLTTDHSDASVTFVESSTEASGIESRVYDLEYVPQDKFKELVDSNSEEALNVFTLDDSFNVLIATWKSDGSSIEISTNSPVDFRSTLQNVTMPYEYLLYLLIDSGNKEFVKDLADMVADTEIIMVVQDNVTTTEINATVQQRKNATVDEMDTDWEEVKSRSQEESSFTETCSTSVEITYADTWFVRYSRENDSYSSHSLGAKKGELVDTTINVRGKVNEETNSESKGYGTDGPYTVGETKTDTYTKLVPINYIVSNYDIQAYRTETVEYKYNIEERYKKTIHTISNSYEEGESVVSEKTNEFVNLYKEYKMANCVKEEWLFQILEKNTKTGGMVDLTKYLIYRATGTSYGVTEYDFSQYDFSAFSGMSGIYGGTLEEKVWFALRGAGYSEIATAGVMGNIEAESGFNAGTIEAGSGIGIGICQWSFGRRTQLEKYAASKGVPWTDENTQIEFLLGELTPGGGANGYANYALVTYNGYSPNDWKTAQDIETATKAFCWSFERPGIPHMDRRIASANKYYNEFKGRTAPSGDPRIGTITLSGDNASKMMAMLTEAVRIADDNRYTYSQANRYGEFQYDCSSLVARLYKKYFDFDAPTTTAGYGSAYNIGKDGSVELKPGDVLWRPGHVEIYIGNGLQVGAHTNQCAIPDQISVVSYTRGYFTDVYRFIQ